MAHKPQSYKLDEKKKVIVLYDNVKPSPVEELMINCYLDKGYKVKIETKKPSVKVAQMREELKEDIEALNKFNELYALKVSKEELAAGVKSGFHQATKFYTDWKKAHKPAKKKAK